MESPTDREREKHNREGDDSHYGVNFTVPSNFSLFKNPLFTHILGLLLGGGSATFAINRGPSLEEIKTEIHAGVISNDSAHKDLGLRIDTTNSRIGRDELTINTRRRR